MDTCGDGIFLKTLSSNNIINNVTTKSIHGLVLDSSSNNVFMNNTVTDSWYGVFLNNSGSNTLIFNTFLENVIRVFFFNVSFNYWDNGVIGNYWSDHECIDNDYNGV